MANKEKTTLQPDSDEVNEEAKSTSNPTDGADETSQPAAEQNKRLEQLEAQLRAIQSQKDKEVAQTHKQYQQQIRSLQEQKRETEQMLEQVLPEEKREEFRLNKLKEENKQLKQKEEMREAKQYIHETFEVPLEVLSDANTPSAVSAAGYAWLAEDRQRLKEALEKNPEEVEEARQKEEIEKAKSDGTLKTTKQRAPSEQARSRALDDAEMQELRDMARQGGRKAQEARMEYFRRTMPSRRGNRAEI